MRGMCEGRCFHAATAGYTADLTLLFGIHIVLEEERLSLGHGTQKDDA